MSTSAVRSSRTERLDDLPVSREHVRLVWGSGIGWALDAFDVGLISFVLAQLAVTWQASPGELSWIASLGFVGMAVGAALGGLLADRVGRRTVFALTLLVYGVATGVSALAWSVAALAALRVVVGLGLGAELPVASTLVSEFAPRRVRGRAVVWLESFWALGWLLAAVVGFLVVPRGDDGWRWALAIGAVPAVYAIVVRLGLPESVRFLELRGRHREAELTVRRFERASGVETVGPLPADEPPGARERGSAWQGVRSLWRPRLRRATGGLWTVWFFVNLSYYGAFIWIPTLLVAAGHTLTKSFEYTLIITLAQLPGYAVAAWLIERWGRRRTLAVFLVGSALAAVGFGTAGSTTAILVFGSLLSFFNLGAWGALYAVTPEVYPTALRGTGAGWAAGAGRVASILAPFLVAWLQPRGVGLLFAVFAAAFAVAAAATTALPERAGAALES
ncbi:major facilitator superfamily MFS_1 [Beutenbergia cavernae DSM 12333]|uniref:Major facilitator superfamily MFS_1 n=1 Tax=Beutenbergia cavernae (strain ATCC BAA-8 / DSM 12333 / CCUG 43141 / JCM 11478 / NBRC 16432 / NCIMB 13614 / HKI 0122) TaxID=471853 RepID=C5BZI6_BEUC1|nr:MFS transporter [Beutenbergia cavernae]ACQ79158.1 major facilitator superfamily MFS_1 [Beutenbergia cavernae DSM 12333]